MAERTKNRLTLSPSRITFLGSTTTHTNPLQDISTMSEELDLDYFKKRLTERYQIILADKEAQKQNTAPKELDQTSVGRLSRIDAMQQQQMAKAAARLVDQERRRIETAFKRIGSEEYGYCILCDEEIAEKRLEFDPSILTCITCAQNAEKT